MISAINGVAATLPMRAPLSYTDVARLRNRSGNQFDTVLAAGRVGTGLPTPNPSRRPNSAPKLFTAPVAPVNNDHTSTEAPNMTRSPNRSMSRPAGICMSA